MMKVLRSVLLCALLLTTHTAFAAKGTLLYIPMDNRPVCLDYTVQTMQAAGWDVQLRRLNILPVLSQQGSRRSFLTGWRLRLVNR